MSELPRVAIFGAGSIGCYIGGWLLQTYNEAPERLLFIGRDTLKAKLESGLKVTDYNGNSFVSHSISSVMSTGQAEEQTSVPIDILLVTIKCTAINKCIDQLSKFITEKTVIVCLQNGIGSEKPIKEHFTKNNIVCGVVGFNSLEVETNHYHRGTAGEVIIEDLNLPVINKLINILNQVNIETELTQQIDAIRWGKLLLNLNNVVNALSGVPLKEELSDRKYRVVLAQAMREVLNTLKRANITPAKLTAVSPNLLPFILKLPTPIFKLVANKMLAIDPLARSSMWYDIENGVETEIDFINGAILAIAQKYHTQTPINLQLVKLMHKAQKNSTGSPKFNADDLYKMLF
ncbi:2-dehydropantoate 2-reductase [Thalassotalea atypica]|uniref:2-dehydropantoate 2-reductase n=1 Tax=Thalassotalea atypica TaxID=2054316 RepID=UPI002573A24A|nr:2-dehydropantoate 2-reductase [Thalassotalea atypica]